MRSVSSPNKLKQRKDIKRIILYYFCIIFFILVRDIKMYIDFHTVLTQFNFMPQFKFYDHVPDFPQDV